MCCFSKQVQSVSDTKIFARASDAGRQYLGYEMSLTAAEDLAMILPLPVPPRTAEDAVRFVSLEKYEHFFHDVARAFPLDISRGFAPQAVRPATKSAPLKVVEVGAFEASFAPTMFDLDRLDPRFRLPIGIWYGVPAYHEFGFAVFKLKRGRSHVHPMAFEFPRRDPSRLFFPTVHVHDGAVHATADFDHALYCQAADPPAGWRASSGDARAFVDVAKAAGVVDGDARMYARELRGTRVNEDIYV